MLGTCAQTILSKLFFKLRIRAPSPKDHTMQDVFAPLSWSKADLVTYLKPRQCSLVRARRPGSCKMKTHSKNELFEKSFGATRRNEVSVVFCRWSKFPHINTQLREPKELSGRCRRQMQSWRSWIFVHPSVRPLAPP